jgi:hypothetical protein
MILMLLLLMMLLLMMTMLMLMMIMMMTVAFAPGAGHRPFWPYSCRRAGGAAT